MSAVSSCRTRRGYPEHAVAIKRPKRKLLRRAKTVPYPTYCSSNAAPPFDTVDMSRNVPTVFTVLSAPDVHGNTLPHASWPVMGKRRRQVILHSSFAATFRPLRPPHTPTFQAGRSPASGLFFGRASRLRLPEGGSQTTPLRLPRLRCHRQRQRLVLLVVTLRRSDLLCVRERFWEGCSSVLG